MIPMIQLTNVQISMDELVKTVEKAIAQKANLDSGIHYHYARRAWCQFRGLPHGMDGMVREATPEEIELMEKWLDVRSFLGI